MSLANLLRLPLMLLLCVALILPGCANTGGEGDDPSDVCRAERVALRNTGENFTKDIVEGAAIGAVAGGLLGLAAGGNLRSAAIGAAAGGVAGAIGGYWRARQKQYADQAQLYQAIYSDVTTENQNIDNTQIAFNHLVACRNTQAARIRADFRAGRISRDLAATAMADVRAHADSDLRLAREISGHIQQRSQDFSYAGREVRTTVYSSSPSSPRTPARRPSTQTVRTANEVQTATSTNLLKRDQFEQSISRAQTNRSAFELS